MSSQLKSDHLFYGIVILIILSPLFFFPSLINLYRLPKTVLISTLVTTLVWLWLFLLIQEKEKRASFPLAMPLTVYFCISVSPLIKAPNPYEGIFALSQELLYVLLFWLVVNHIRTRDQIEKLLLWAVPSAVIVSLTGIYQRFGGDIPGLVNIAPPGSTFGNKNSAAQYILLLLPLPYFFLIYTTNRQKEIFLAISASTISTYLLYTGTRAAWAGAIVASLTIFILLRLKKSLLAPEVENLTARIWDKKISLGCIVLVVSAMNLIPPYVVPNWDVGGVRSPAARFETALDLDQDPSFLFRLALWANTLEIFEDHPLLGVGKGNFKITYPRYAAKAIKDPSFSSEAQPREAHNDYVQLLAETGALGLLCLFWILAIIGRKVWRSVPGKKDSYWIYLITVLSLSLLSLLAEAFFDFPFELPVSAALFWVLAGFLWISCENNSLLTAPSLAKEGRICSRTLGLISVGSLSVLSILLTTVHFTFLRAEYHFSRGAKWSSQKQWQLAEQEVKKAEYFNPTTHRYPFVRGLIDLQMEKYQNAIEANLRTLALHPNYINAYTNLGVAYASTGKTREAEWAWRKALEIWPDHNDARNNLATVYAVHGKRQEAIALFKESLIRDPQDAEAKKKLKILLGQINQPPKP